MKKRLFTMKTSAALLSVCMVAGILSGCGTDNKEVKTSSNIETAGSDSTASGEEKVFYYGDTTFNAENDESDVNPHKGYSGWACIRYGIGETLFRYSNKMELEPWLAAESEMQDENTWKITLRDNISFTS